MKNNVDSKFEPKNIKGASDFLPSVQVMRNRVIDTLKRNFELCGYLPLETALLNYYELLSYKYEDDAEILHEIYKMKDQGERDLGLRFDLTVPFCKVIAMNRNLRMPFKRYEIGKVFRNGPVKLGRTREFYQCDIDCVGAAGPHIEAEIIALAVKCFLELGIQPLVLFGNRKLLISIIQGVGIAADKTDSVIGIIDRMTKVKSDELQIELAQYMTPKQCGQLLAILKSNPTNDEVLELQKIFVELGIDKYCKFAPYLARGLNIYTGTVWEVYDAEKRISSAIGGGGRYDNIITNFISNGQSYPAVGMSFGLEPISAILGGTDADTVKLVDIMIVPMRTESYCQKFAESLRAQGIKANVWLGGKTVGKALEYTNAEKIPYAVVIGENEISSGKIIIKKMSTGETQEFKSSDTGSIKQYINLTKALV